MNRRPRTAAPLTRERIAAAAIDTADEHGFEAVSMRRVAEHLGSGTMSLYRHIADKEELVSAMVDRVAGRYAYPDPAGMDWRERMHALARTDWRMFVEHPWMLAATANLSPPFGAESLAGMEWALDALEPAGLEPHQAAQVVMTVNHYVQGSVRVVLGEAARSADTDDPGANWRQRLHDVDLERFPRLHDLVRRPLPRTERDWFAEGLDVILDGVQSRLAPRTDAPGD
ncbi:TetR/AcrR family transcriptional regulator [Streptomonospora litoralis]|uniref:Tetracycline repressor protein class A n=1 Tax=Streptomonospora litoralis TaxID=2498135 RepID=A0A4P6PXT7_9ACTN|nr:TetR/AcrR family transcriptional regulator [Streptomonospora litoralis]QBI53086.1 Tetracycline repressor protein class A [Streptomonospora litoralis]